MEKVRALVREQFGKELEKVRPEYGAISGKIDYFKIAEEQFGMQVKKAKILVAGVGGCGCNCINRLTQLGIEGALTVAINTDAKHLAITQADRRILIGKELTRGLGAGGYPEIGKKAAEESRNEIKEVLNGVDLSFICLGLGGGTGTGAGPIVAEISKSAGAITIGVAIMPMKVEGARLVKAEYGLCELRKYCDTVIVMENDRLLKCAGQLPLQQAFAIADEFVASMVKGITETITLPSLVQLDYADVKTVMKAGGVAAIGVGESNSSDRARDATLKALENPLLEADYTGANGALIHITGGPDLKLEECYQIAEMVSQYLDPSAQLVWGARILPEFNKLQVITIITGVKSPYILGPSYKEPENKVKEVLGIKILR